MTDGQEQRGPRPSGPRPGGPPVGADGPPRPRFGAGAQGGGRPGPGGGGGDRDRGDRERGGDRDRGGDRGRRGGGGGGRFQQRRKVCMFCMDKVDQVDYKDIARLRRNLAERGKIEPRRKFGTCARHQRSLTTAIKRARHVALIPFTTSGGRS